MRARVGLKRFLDVVVSAGITRIIAVAGFGLVLYAATVPFVLEVPVFDLFTLLPLLSSILCFGLWFAWRTGMLRRLRVHRLAFAVFLICSVNVAGPLYMRGAVGYIMAVALLVVVVSVVFLRPEWYWFALTVSISLAGGAFAVRPHSLNGAPGLWLLVAVALSITVHRTLLGNFRWIFHQRSLLKAAASEAARGRERLRVSEGFANAVSSISARFINLDIGRIDEQIDQALGVIARYCNVDRCSLYTVNDRAGIMTNAHEWCAQGVTSLQQLFDGVVPLDAFPWIRKRLQLLETVELSSVDDLPADAEAERDRILHLGIKSLMLVPISNEGHIRGFFELSTSSTEIVWNHSFRNILQIAAQSFSNALVRKEMEQRLRDHIVQRREAERQAEKLQRMEAEFGARIQRTLLFGHIPSPAYGLEVYASTRPSRTVDGDFYEFVSAESGLDVVIGDVMGKGTPAALVAAAVKSQFWQALLGANTRRLDADRSGPHRIVDAVSANMAGELVELSSFFTLSYTRFDVRAGVCRIVDCGHPPLLRYVARTGSFEWVRGVNLPVGMREDELYAQLVLPLEAGDIFVAYSDGVTEAQDESGELFGYKRLAKAVEPVVHSTGARGIVEAVESAVQVFSGDSGLVDDITCAVTCVDTGYECPTVYAEHEIAVGASGVSVERVRGWVRPHLQQVEAFPHFSGINSESIGSALCEAFSNVVQHGYRDMPETEICISMRVFGDWILLQIDHWGSSFDPADYAEASNLSSARGHGLSVMDEVFDSVTYTSTTTGRQHIYMAKSYGGEKNEPAGGGKV